MHCCFKGNCCFSFIVLTMKIPKKKNIKDDNSKIDTICFIISALTRTEKFDMFNLIIDTVKLNKKRKSRIIKVWIEGLSLEDDTDVLHYLSELLSSKNGSLETIFAGIIAILCYHIKHKNMDIAQEIIRACPELGLDKVLEI
jgi:hypothetical protein